MFFDVTVMKALPRPAVVFCLHSLQSRLVASDEAAEDGKGDFCEELTNAEAQFSFGESETFGVDAIAIDSRIPIANWLIFMQALIEKLLC